MSPLLRKEVRLILPAWLAAVAAAMLLATPWREFDAVWMGGFAIAMLALVLAPFGQETSHGTFGLLLVQPEDRRRFWRVKTILLGAAAASAWVVFALCVLTANWPDHELSNVLRSSALMALVAFSGGLWTTLLLRDMISSLFVTCIVPAIILAVTMACAQLCFAPDSQEGCVILVWLLESYAVISFAWARRLFLDAQDVPWTGGQLSLTTKRGLSLRWLAFSFRSKQDRWSALVKKELQLQEITMLLVPVMVLLYFGGAAVRHFFPQWFQQNDWLANAIPLLWLGAVPLVIGCVAVAEERRFNTLESQLCVPVRQWQQLLIKFAVVLVLGVVLGGMIPWALIHWFGIHPQDLEFLTCVEAAAVVVTLAFYASTMTRGLLQALPAVVCIPILTILPIALLARFTITRDFPLVQSSLFPTVMGSAAVLTLGWLSFKNYQQVRTGWPMWVGNLWRAGAAMTGAAVLSVAVFDRSWELFLTMEPHHGAAKLSGPVRPCMAAEWNTVRALLPDGRIWASHRPRKKTFSGNFIPANNWTKLAAGGFTWAYAIREDGTLWNIATNPVSQFGLDSDWKEIAGCGATFLAVKQNGTLWGWGEDRNELLTEHSTRYNAGPGIKNPIRLGTESDWANVFLTGNNRAAGVKQDGSIWLWGYQPNIFHGHRGQSQIEPAEQGNTYSITHKIRGPLDPGNWISVCDNWLWMRAIRADGTLWQAKKGWQGSGGLPPARFGAKSDWTSLTGDWRLTALEADGKLSVISDEDDVKKPSKYHDWIASAQYSDRTWALAKDGTLCCWDEFGINEPEQRDATFWQKFFLGPSRRPVATLNILSQ